MWLVADYDFTRNNTTIFYKKIIQNEVTNWARYCRPAWTPCRFSFRQIRTPAASTVLETPWPVAVPTARTNAWSCCTWCRWGRGCRTGTCRSNHPRPSRTRHCKYMKLVNKFVWWKMHFEKIKKGCFLRTFFFILVLSIFG